MDNSPFRATDILSATVTVASLALALAAIQPDSPLVTVFLVSGLFSTGGSLYSLAALLEELGFKPLRMTRGEQHVPMGTREVAVICAVVGLLILTAAYIGLLFATFL